MRVYCDNKLYFLSVKDVNQYPSENIANEILFDYIDGCTVKSDELSDMCDYLKQFCEEENSTSDHEYVFLILKWDRR